MLRCDSVARGIATFVVLTVLAPAAHANPDAIVPGGIDPSGRIDAVGSIDYTYEQDTSNIWREHVGDPNADPNAPLPTHRDLSFQQYRHTITPRLDVGLVHNTWIYAALPIVIAQARELHLDTGVDRAGSSTVIDGILPMAGYDARDPSVAPSGDLMFRGVNRYGLDQIYLGFGVAPMNQADDDTKATWKIGAEARVAVGKVMKFDPMAPGDNTAVGEGVHELRLWTTFDRRLGWAEPWAEFFWQTPLAVTSSSLFQDAGYGSTYTEKGQQAGVAFGFEAYAVDNPIDHNRISFEVGTHVIAHFEGRDYSEMWEAFAFAGDPRSNGPLVIDSDPVTPGVQAMAYPGISNIENYLETRAHVAIRAELGPRVRFAILGDVIWKTDHAISFADAGVDLPTCSATVTTHCEVSNNTVINPGTVEVNPLQVPLIDLVGHRYISEQNLGFIIGVQTQILF